MAVCCSVLTASALADTVITDNVTLQTGDTPKLTLMKSGDAANSWSISGNEVSLKLISTVGSVPLTALRVDKGSPSNSLRIAKAGYFGFGTATPQVTMHVVKSAEAGAESIARFQVADNSMARLEINNASTTTGLFVPRIQGKSDQLFTALTVEALVSTDTGTEPAMIYNAAGLSANSLVNRPLVAFRNNNVAKVTIAANGDLSATSFNPSSSRQLKDRIANLDGVVAAEALQKLTPVTFVYKDDASRESRVGFIAEDVPELVANAGRKSVPIMDVVALLTRAVKDQRRTIEGQTRSLDGQQSVLDRQQTVLRQQDQAIEDQTRSLQQHRKTADEQVKLMNELTRRLKALEQQFPQE